MDSQRCVSTPKREPASENGAIHLTTAESRQSALRRHTIKLPASNRYEARLGKHTSGTANNAAANDFLTKAHITHAYASTDSSDDSPPTCITDASETCQHGAYMPEHR